MDAEAKVHLVAVRESLPRLGGKLPSTALPFATSRMEGLGAGSHADGKVRSDLINACPITSASRPGHIQAEVAVFNKQPVLKFRFPLLGFRSHCSCAVDCTHLEAPGLPHVEKFPRVALAQNYIF